MNKYYYKINLGGKSHSNAYTKEFTNLKECQEFKKMYPEFYQKKMTLVVENEN